MKISHIVILPVILSENAYSSEVRILKHLLQANKPSKLSSKEHYKGPWNVKKINLK